MASEMASAESGKISGIVMSLSMATEEVCPVDMLGGCVVKKKRGAWRQFRRNRPNRPSG